DARALGDAEPQAAEQPIEIELAVTDAREVRVAQEVVTPVYVEGPAHGARKEGDGMASAHQIDDALRKRGVEAHEDAMHLGRWVEHEPERPFLVPSGLRERLFEEVRERTVAEIVQERGRQGLPRALRRDPLFLGKLGVDGAQAAEQTGHHVGRPERVREARVIGPRIRERRETHLPNPAQALELLGFEERWNYRLLGGFEGDETVHRVAKDHKAGRVYTPSQRGTREAAHRPRAVLRIGRRA